jgi:AcrR family transcriptional regulator
MKRILARYRHGTHAERKNSLGQRCRRGGGRSRATAYRYFPTQAAMIQDAVDEALGPILAWHSDSAQDLG